MYIGVDCGTQSTKVVLVDGADGRIIGEASRPHALDQGDNGRREQRVESWTEAFRGALGDALTQAGVDGREVRAIGISGQQHGMVALDAEGMAVHPAKLWNDTETAAWNADLIERLGGEAGCLDKLGLVLQTGYTASKIAWLRETHPQAYARIATLLLPHDYLNFWLTGERVAEAGDASGTGYFDTRNRQWRHDVFAVIAPELDPAQVLPRLIDSREAAGTVRPELARELGLGEDVLVASGGGDNMMGAIGTGNIVPGRVTISLGTSGTIAVHSPEPVVPDNAMVANFCASHAGWLPLICTMNVTSATTTMRELVGLDIAGFNRAVERAEPGAGGVTRCRSSAASGYRRCPRPTPACTASPASTQAPTTCVARRWRAPPSACATGSSCWGRWPIERPRCAWSAVAPRARCGVRSSLTCWMWRWCVRW